MHGDGLSDGDQASAVERMMRTVLGVDPDDVIELYAAQPSEDTQFAARPRG